MTRAALVLTLASVSVARADPAPEVIDVDRDDAPPARGELGFDGGAPLGGDWAIAIGAADMERPISLAREDGATTAPVVRRQTLSLGGAITLGDSALADLHVGLAHQRGDRLAGLGLGDDAALDRWVALDARLGLRVRVRSGAHVSVFLRGELTVPTGDDHDFAGDAGWTGAWTLIARVAALPAGITVAGAAGVRIRGAEVAIGDRLVGNEVTGALGVVVPVPALCPLWCKDQVAISGELVGIAGDKGDAKRGPSPAEARLGVISRPRPWLEIAARAGLGLDDEIGAPSWRASLAIAWRFGAERVARPAPVPPTLDDEDL